MAGGVGCAVNEAKAGCKPALIRAARTFRLTLAFALLVDLLATLTLAVLDKIIGP